MGITASFLKLPTQQRFEAIFVDDVLREGFTRLKQSSSLRTSFVAYVKSGLWETSLCETERRRTIPSQSIWGKYGYKKHCQASDVTPLKSKSSERSQTSRESSLYAISETFAQSLDVEPLTLFTDPEDARALLFVLLYPLFESLRSASETDHNVRDDVVEFFSSITGDLQHMCPHDPPHHEGSRRQEILLELAATCDESCLLDYLADPSSDFIEDFARAMEKLPVKMMVGQIHQELTELPVVYSNFQLNTSTKEAMGLPMLEQDIVGQNLHILYGNMCSPGAAQLLERAMFSGKAFKKSIGLPNRRCKLLAFCPINGTQQSSAGAPVYSVSLESVPFVDPEFLSGTPREGHCQETPFRQIEDMIALLPLLIRR